MQWIRNQTRENDLINNCINPSSGEMKYPAEFHFRVICDATVDISADIRSAAAFHKITGELEESNCSRSGKFRSYSISVFFEKQNGMVRFDEAVKAIPGVRMLL